jgi:cobalamin biosynthesis protein CobD/CbiB
MIDKNNINEPNAIFHPAKDFKNLQDNNIKKSKDIKKDKTSAGFICLVSIALFLLVLLLVGIIALIIVLNVSTDVSLNCGNPAITPVIDYSNKLFKVVNGDQAVSHSFPWMVINYSY